jgi:hypothetical protein
MLLFFVGSIIMFNINFGFLVDNITR